MSPCPTSLQSLCRKRVESVMSCRLSCLAKRRGHQASERRRVAESQVSRQGRPRRLVVHGTKQTGKCPLMSQALARHGQEELDGVVGAVGNGHGGPARLFLIKEAPAEIDFLTMRAVARYRRVVLAEDPGWPAQTLVVPGGHFNLHCKRCAYANDRLL